jgi:diguanylate cyclase (GGDEF)-like protein
MSFDFHMKTDINKSNELLLRADLHWKSGNISEAIQSIRECLSYHSANVDAYLLACKIYLDNSYFNIAFEVLNELHSFSLPSRDSLILKAKVELKLKKYVDAEAIINNFLKNGMEDEEILLLLADLSQQTGEYKKSIQIYEKLLENQRWNITILYNLALSYYLSSEWNETIFYCQQIIETGHRSAKVDKLYRQSLNKKREELVDKSNSSLLGWIKLKWIAPISEEQILLFSENERQIRKKEYRTFIDESTGALNFRAMMDYVPSFLLNSKKSVFVSLVDIDYFKAFNEFYSHQVADQILKVLVYAGEKFFQKNFFRRGGEEFVWVMETEVELMLKQAREFRIYTEEVLLADANNYLKKMQIVHPRKKTLYQISHLITISQGISQYKTEGQNIMELLEVADDNLRSAKLSGRNAIFFKNKMVDQGQLPKSIRFDGRDGN